MATIARLKVVIEGENSGLARVMKDSEEKASAFGGALTKVAGIAAGVFAADAIIGGIKSMVGGFLDLSSSLTDLSAKTGISAEGLQKLKFAAEQNGSTLETLATASTQLSKRIAGGGDSVETALSRMGLSLSAIRQLSPEKQFFQIGDAIAKVQNPTEQVALAMQLFGKAGAEVLPVMKGNLSETAAQAERLGIIISDDVIAAGDQFGDLIGVLQSQLMAMTATALEPMLPILTALAEGFISWASSAMPAVAGAIRGFITDILDAERGIYRFLQGLAEGLTKIPLAGKAMFGAADAAEYFKGRADKAELALFKFVLTTAEATPKIEAVIPPIRASADELAKQAREAEKAAEKMDKLVAKYDEFAEKLQASGRAQGAAELARAAEKSLDFFNKQLEKTIDLMGKESDLRWAPRFAADIEAAMSIGRDSIKDFILQTDRLNDELKAALGVGLKDSAKEGWNAFKTELVSGMKGLDIGALIIGAIQGGGNIAETIGAGLGNILGKSLGQTLATAIGGTLGGIVGSFAGPLGALAGGALGGLVDKLFGPSEHEKVNDMRDSFIDAAGGLETLNVKAAEAGVSLNALLVAKKIEDFNREMERLNEAFKVEEQRQAFIEAAGGLDILKLKAELAGVSLQAMLKATTVAEYEAAINSLNAAFEAQASRVAGLERAAGGLEQRIKAFGTTAVDALSKGTTSVETLQGQFNDLGTITASIFRDILRETGSWTKANNAVAPSLDELMRLEEQLGVQATGALKDMLEFRRVITLNQDVADSVQGTADMVRGLGQAGTLTQDKFDIFLKQAAADFQTLTDRGVAADAALALMQPTLQALWEAQQTLGLKVDENIQNLIDLGLQMGIIGPGFMSDSDRMITAIEGLQTVLESIRDILQGLGSDAASAANQINNAGQNINPWQVPIEYQDPGPPPIAAESFAGGSHGLRDFGRGTMAVLHGREAVVTEGEFGRGRGSVTVVTHVHAEGSFFDSNESMDKFAEKVGDAQMQRYELQKFTSRAA